MAALSLRCSVGASCSFPSSESSLSSRRGRAQPFPHVFYCKASVEAPSMLRTPFMGATGVGLPRLGLALRAFTRVGFHPHPQQGQRGMRSSSAARAVWKQEVLWTDSKLVEIEKAGESLFHVVLDISNNPELIDGYTRAGQFVQIKVGNIKPAFMAIASPPTLAKKGRFEFLIKDPGVEDSTAGILCSLGKGDEVELSQVMGNGFKVEQLEPADDYKTVLLFATGSGISPIRSLIEEGFGLGKRPDVRLYYGARNLERMAYQEKFKDWEASGVQVLPVLSQPDSNWSGAKGYVQAFFSKNMGISNPTQTGAVLCGHKGMAQDVTGLLVAEGVLKDKILLNF